MVGQFQPVSGLGTLKGLSTQPATTFQGQGLGSVESLWSAFVDFWDTTIPTSDWIKGNVGTTAIQPDYQPAKPGGPVVPQGALDPSTGYHPYTTDYAWCSPTDAECLNGITNRPDPNLEDARKNITNYTSEQLDAIKKAENDASKKNSQQILLLVAAGVVVFLVASKR